MSFQAFQKDKEEKEKKDQEISELKEQMNKMQQVTESNYKSYGQRSIWEGFSICSFFYWSLWIVSDCYKNLGVIGIYIFALFVRL